MNNMNINYHITLSGYFSGKTLYLYEPTQKKPNTRKLVEQPWQQTKAEMWDELTETLCNLDFIQAKAAAKMTYELVGDFNAALLNIPDNAENIRKEKEQQSRLDKYVKDLVLYAKGEISELEIPETVPLWSEEKINAEIGRMKTNPTRLDRLKDFKNFLGQVADNLQNYANEFPHFATQQAWNYVDSGPVGISSEKGTPDIYKPLLLCSNSTRPLWNPLPQAIHTLKGHTFSVYAVAITPDGKRAISGSGDKTCIFWDLNTGQAIHTLKGHNAYIYAVAITPDGKRAIFGSGDHTCILWDLNTGKAIHTLKGHAKEVVAIAITPDGERAISGSWDNTCIIWDLNTGQAINTLKGHTSAVHAVALTPNGKKAISGSNDKTCILWDLNTGQAIITLMGHTHSVTAVAITADGKRAISGSRDKTLSLIHI